MFVTLSTYFYVGVRMLNHSHKDVVYTNADLMLRFLMIISKSNNHLTFIITQSLRLAEPHATNTPKIDQRQYLDRIYRIDRKR
jgi:hypothetical protein